MSTLQVFALLGFVATTGALDLYKCEPVETVSSDDGYSLNQSIPLKGGLPFYGGVYNSYYVGINGIVQFAQELSTEKTIIGTFPDTRYTFIAPFYGDLELDGTNKSHVSFCIVNNTDNKLDFSNYTNITLPLSIVATWSKIGYNSNDSLANTFQCVIQTDGEKTFAIFLYKKLQWTAQNPVHVGFNNGTNRAFWKMPCSGTEDIVSLVNTSNVGVDGVWVFRVDGETIEPACTNKETCNNDELCSCLQDCRGQYCLCKEAVNTCSKGDMEDDCNLLTMSAPVATTTLLATTTPVATPTLLATEPPSVEGDSTQNECKKSTVAIVVTAVVLSFPLLISFALNIVLILRCRRPAKGSTTTPPPAKGSTTTPPPAEGSTATPPPAEGPTTTPPPAEGPTTTPPPGEAEEISMKSINSKE